jgi:hypothetical protein
VLTFSASLLLFEKIIFADQRYYNLKTHPGLLLPVLLALLTGCGNDIEVMAPYKSIPVVHCIINPQQDYQYLRLGKSFMGEANAYDMARQEDSVYYPDAEVYLERWADGERKEQFLMEKVSLSPRDSGVFISQPNYLYRTDARLRSQGEYRLNIHIPSTGAEISAITKVVAEFRAIRPEYYKKNLAFSTYDNYETVEWVTAPYTRIYQLTIRFHYLEVIKADTAFKTIDWNYAQYITDNAAGGQDIVADVLHRNFYKFLANNFDKPTSGMIRLANHQALDFIFTVGGEELYTYMQIYGEDSGILKEKPVYTNIVNGIGLFSSRFEQSITGKSLTNSSIDSLSYGMYTKGLGFDDSLNDYYTKGS